MRVPFLVPVLGCALALPAQIPPMAKLMFEQYQRQNVLGLLLVEPPIAKKSSASMPPMSDFERELRNVLRAEVLSDLSIEVTPLRTGDGEGLTTWARQAYGLGAGRAWALVDGQGKCLAKGTKAPKAEVLAERLAGLGIQGPTRQLRAFLRQHPDHLEARCALLKELRKIAERRTRAVLKVDVKTFQEDMREGKFRFSLAGLRVPDMPKDVRPLTAEEDVLVWNAYAGEVDRLFKEGTWQEAELLIQDMDSLPLEAYSPAVKEVYRRHVGKVEEALEARPTNGDLWGLWVWMAKVLGDRPARPLVARLEPVPAAFRESPWPPRALREALVKEAKASSDWGGVKEVLLPQWEEQRQLATALGGNAAAMGMGVGESMLEEAFDSIGEPLLEAMFRTGDAAAAEAIGAEVLAWKWEGGSARLAAVARRCDRADLAVRWARAQSTAK